MTFGEEVQRGKRSVFTAVLLGVAAVACVGALVQHAQPLVGSAAGGPTRFDPVDAKLVQEVLSETQERLEKVELADLERSQAVREIASQVPEVRAMLEDPAKAQQFVNFLHAGARVLKGMREDIACKEAACPQGSGELAALTGLSKELLALAENVLQDPEVQALLADGAAAPQTVGFLGGLRAAAPPRADAAMAARKKAAPKRKPVKSAGNMIGNFQTPTGSDIGPTDIGVTEPLGIFDPQGFMTNTASYAPFPWAPPRPQFFPDDTKYRRWQELEIKHGRIAMLATVHVLVTTFGIKWPYINLAIGSTGLSEFDSPLAFTDIPGGTWASWAGIPAFGWAQIVCLVALLDNTIFAQDPEKEPGNVVPDQLPWVRYDDSTPYEAPLGGLWPFPGSSGGSYMFPSEKAYKLSVERNNGRAAMLGIFGMMFHEALTGNPVWPIPADVEGGVFAALR